MSDTINSLTEAGTASTDIDLDAVRENIDDLTVFELQGVARDLGVSDKGTKAVLRKTIADHIAGEKGEVSEDVTHENAQPKVAAPAEFDIPRGAPAPPMVGGFGEPVTDVAEVEGAIVSRGKKWWQNPYTGNKVIIGCNDTDGRGDVDGVAVYVSVPDPTVNDINEDDE